MKKILAILALTCFAGFASAQSMKVINNTTCTVYFTIHYSNTSNLCYIASPPSTIVAISPSATLYYDLIINPPAGAPGITYFNGMRILDRDYTACSGLMGFDIGDPCLFPYQQQYIPILNSSCQACSTIDAAYDNTDPINPVVVFN